MSRYETLRAELGALTARQAAAVLGPAVIASVCVLVLVDGSGRLSAALAALVLLPLVFHLVWRPVIPAYRQRSRRAAVIRAEIVVLKGRIAAVFDKYPVRRRGEHFKRVYALAGRTTRDLEEALSVGMYRERREVFVTAFMRDGVAVRVTASIGTPFRCAAADDPRRWAEHVVRLGCDEIRQYHNHPAHNGHTAPSRTDIRSSGLLRRTLGPHGGKLRSLIICWNAVREWKVFEYDEAGRHSLHFEFDAACMGERDGIPAAVSH